MNLYIFGIPSLYINYSYLFLSSSVIYASSSVFVVYGLSNNLDANLCTINPTRPDPKTDIQVYRILVIVANIPALPSDNNQLKIPL